MSTFPRIKLQWATARQQPGNWYLGLFGLYERKTGGRSRGLAISLRGLLLWGMLACVVGYCSVAAYVVWRLDQRTYNFVRYTDILLYPVRHKHVDELRGQASIAEGFDALKKNDWRGGIMLLRIGLEKYPRDLKARLEVARFFLAAKLRAKAQETILEGLKHGYPGRAYLESAVGIVLAGEDHELVIELCERGLALHDPARNPAADRRWLVEQRLRALLAEQRVEEVLSTIDTLDGELDENSLNEVRLLALLQAKRVDEAAEFVDAWRARVGPRPQIQRLQVRIYREKGRLDEMAAVLEELRKDNPADARVRVFALIQNFMAGREAEASAQLEDYIFRFGGTQENFILVAEPLSEIRRLRELDIVLAAAAERGFRDVRLGGARLQVLIAERRWAEAGTQIENMRSRLSGPDAVARAGLLEFFQVLIGAASDPAEGAQTNLTNFLAIRQLSMIAYRQSIEVLRASGRVTTARDVVRLAEGVFPGNRYLETTRDALDAEIEKARSEAESRRVVKTATPAFASPAVFYAALTRAREEGGAEAGLALLRELRQAQASWAAGEAEPLARLELELRAEGDDPVLLQAAARAYVNPDRLRIQNAITVATRLFEAGRKTDARLVLDEVLRRVPDQPAAQSLKLKWFAPPKPAAEASVSPAAPAPAAAP